MKSFLSALIFTTGTFFLIPGATSQEQPGCFMVSPNGEIVDLNNVCQGQQVELEASPNSSSNQNAQSGVYEIPIQRRKGRVPVVEVTFNGNQTFEMLFDTGASGILISEQVAQELGVEPEGTAIVETASDREAEFQTGRVDSVEAGGLKRENIRVAIGNRIDLGLLGQSFFGDFDVTIREDVVVLRERD
ncbi:retropepsin-like aspartic protease [Geitlerinema sp. PCC 9228]|jgi:aspartyl protease family protein|uniref:retropepsin-like aspartic protease family protein n=1 Tax=Geitlerinema sp. PCC 9228 TaxID=111611 RepID=UPI000A67F5A2|nr:retropepsin-like aspartic protease [Geitlerinema sp. PCC 9228]